MKTNVRNTLLAALLGIVCTGKLGAAPLNIRTWRNPWPTGNILNNVVHGTVNGNGLFPVAGAGGGVEGTILVSTDGVNWAQPFSGTANDLVTWVWIQNVTFTAGTPSQSVSQNIGNYNHGCYVLGPPAI
ncbi:MAG TPA: hypothetical protein VFB55_00770 [Verrucomicrobiae bacterium]|nr:hypothetical protein [Verrucomicrobiae bacterium]